MAKDPVDAALDSSLLDTKILAALETSPRVEIPPGFAARVAGQMPERPPLVLTPRRYSTVAAAACVLVVFALMVAFAFGSRADSPSTVIIESILCLQFVLLTVWILARNAGYTLPDSF